jgi:hypothetical protein
MNRITWLKRRLFRAWAKRRVRALVETEPIVCPLCSSSSFNVLHTKDRYGLESQVVKCECGFVYQNPILTDAFLSKFYNSYLFRCLDWGVLKATEALAKEFKANERAEKHYLFITSLEENKTIKISSTLLDIGASEGTFLKTIHRNHPTLEISAVEPGKNFSALIGNITRNVWADLDEIPAEYKFDTITLWHVLEHTKNPREFVKKIVQHLNPEGNLIVEVPDFDRYGSEITPIHIDHTLHFNEGTLTRLMKEFNMEPLVVTRDKKYVMDEPYGIKMLSRLRR